ncbi:MAG: Xaa-Pro peptidase family protein [Pseudomonadota bacterium]
MDRYSELRGVATALGVEATALVPGPNFERLYAKAFASHERPFVIVIPADGPPAAIVPNLELSSFALIDFEGEVFDWRDQDGYQAAFDALMGHLPVRSLAVEGQVMRVFVHHAFVNAAPGLRIIDGEHGISGLRLRKTDAEIAAIERAVVMAETALEETLTQVRAGQTEKHVESLLTQALFRAGAEAHAFDPLVASGDHSARAHASARVDGVLDPGDALLIDFGARAGGVVSDLTRTVFVGHATDEAHAFDPLVASGDHSARAHASARVDGVLDPGDALLIDFGARAGGVVSDLTRTVFVGHATDEAQAVYDTVLRANLAGHAATRAGATAHDVDDTVISILEASPYADRIRTKTGHGMGREVHEAPYIMRGNHQVLEPNMVFTIEPGLYKAGAFGVRIEDDVVVTATGCRSLTRFPKALRVVG